MKMHELAPPRGSRRPRKRVGRGISAGQGKTCGRGQKGQGARPGKGTGRGFEGGQMPLVQRVPKLRGFVNRWRKPHVVVNVGKLNRLEAGTVVDAAALEEAGLIDRAGVRVKVLGEGHLKVPLTVRVESISAKARAAVEAAGGRVETGEPAQTGA